MTVELLQTLSLVFYIVAGVFLVLSAVVFFAYSIPGVIGDLSGATARKAIEEIRQQNEESGAKVYRSSSVNMARGKVTEKISPSGKLRKKTDNLGVHMGTQKFNTVDLMPDAPETTVLQASAPETTVLQASAPETTVLQASAPETTVLQPSAPETTVLWPGMEEEMLQAAAACEPMSDAVFAEETVVASGEFGATTVLAPEYDQSQGYGETVVLGDSAECASVMRNTGFGVNTTQFEVLVELAFYGSSEIVE